MRATVDMIIKDLFSDLGSKKLTESQVRFVDGAKRYFKRNKTLSEKQINVLFEMRKYAV
jgi:hypothetical protein